MKILQEKPRSRFPQLGTISIDPCSIRVSSVARIVLEKLFSRKPLRVIRPNPMLP